VKLLRSYINLPGVVGVLCVAAGAAALACTLAQNASFGESLGHSWRGVLISAGGSIIMDSFAAILAIVVGLFLAGRRYGAALLVTVPLAFYLLYSIFSSFGFGLNERMAKAERARVEAFEARSAVERQNALILSERGQTRATLAASYGEASKKASNTRYSRAARAEAAAEAERITSALSLLDQTPPALRQLPPAPEAILADPQAEFIARWSGLNPETVAAAQIAWLAIGLPLAKMLGFLLAPMFFHQAGVRARARYAELTAEPESKPAPPVVTVADDVLQASLAQAIEAANDDSAPPAVPAEVEDDFVDRQHAQINDVVSYITHATEPAPNCTVGAREFLRHYKDWSKMMGRTPTVSNTIEFGHLLRGYGLGRVENGRGTAQKVLYVGRRLRPLQDLAAKEVGLKLVA
jgi:hypothetical protein